MSSSRSLIQFKEYMKQMRHMKYSHNREQYFQIAR